MSRKVALLIGVSEYGEGIPSLSAPFNDVEAMKQVLENPEMGGFEVKTLIDPEPILMQKRIKKLFTNCGKGDLVLLFFSGHGITDDDNKLYLATRITAKDDFDATAVPASFVQKQSKNSYAKRQVIILDCCYSGAFAEGWQAKSVGIDLEKELGAEGRVVLTSSTATQTSFQQEDEELSLYTQYLVEGIETGAADKDEDGKIYAHELHDYAKAKVQEVKPKQKPGIIIDREGFNILLGQAPVNDPKLKFRKLVEKYASKGEISSYRREILKIEQQEFNLTDEKAERIINSVLRPFHRHLDNLQKYRENYQKQVEKQYPLDKTLAQDLKDWGQQVLGLQDEDLTQIEQDINAKKKAEIQHQQEAQQQEQEEYNNKLKQYEQEFLKAVEREYPLSNNTRHQINIRQQSLGLRDEDIKQIEQPILAVKYQEKEKHRQRYKEQEVERVKPLELQKQQEREESQQGKEAEKLKRDKQEPLRQELVNSYQPAVTPVVSPNATATFSYSSTKYQSSTPQPKLQPASSTTTPAENHSNPLSSLQKTRILVGSGITAALTLVLTLSFLDSTPQPEQNGNTQPPVSEQKSPTTSQMTAKDFFDRGLDKQNKGDNPGAIEDYTQAIQLNQNWGNPSETYFGLPTAYNNRGNAHYDQGDYQKAIEDYNQVIELQPDYVSAYNNRGNAHYYLKDYQSAIEDYNQVIELQPDYASAYNNRGNAHYDQRDYQAAIKNYTKAIELQPDYASAYYNRGLAHKNLKDYQAAIKDYTKAIELQPDHSPAYYNRGLAHKNLKDYQSAIEDYQKAADLYKQQGKTDDYQDAIDQIKELEMLPGIKPLKVSEFDEAKNSEIS